MYRCRANGFELITLAKDDDHEKQEKIKDADFVLIATAKLTEDLLKHAKKLKFIQYGGE